MVGDLDAVAPGKREWVAFALAASTMPDSAW